MLDRRPTSRTTPVASWSCYNPPLRLQGRAERAGPGMITDLGRRRATSALTPERRSIRPSPGGHREERGAPGAVPLLSPPGHVGVGALSPGYRPHGHLAAGVSAGARAARGVIPPAPDPEACKITVRSARPARHT